MTRELNEKVALLKAPEQPSDERSEILAKVSHELRTPLTAAQESVLIVLEELTGPLSGQQREFLTVAHRNIQRLKRLIEDLLDLSPSQNDSEPLAVAPTDLRTVVNAALEARRALGERPVLRWRAGEGPLVVAADFERMRQAICRLLDNAAYYAAEEPVRLTVRRAGGSVRVEVDDNGPGIPAYEAERIFEPFVQLGAPAKRGPGRAGLGLTLARQFVERQGGLLWAESPAEGGARFVISLMLLSEDADDEHNGSGKPIIHSAGR